MLQFDSFDIKPIIGGLKKKWLKFFKALTHTLGDKTGH